VVLRADVKAFYASVSPTVLAATLTGLGAGRSDAHEAAAMVDGWSSDGYPGLPIGPPGSAVLANALLRPVDRALGRFRFLRWVDDYLVAVASDRTAEEALERIEGSLSRLGLVLNRSKTAIDQWDGVWPGGRHGPASLAPRMSAGTIAAP
jgi:Reverse transcriptase (RNA-dependent DNA polymerase)